MCDALADASDRVEPAHASAADNEEIGATGSLDERRHGWSRVELVRESVALPLRGWPVEASVAGCRHQLEVGTESTREAAGGLQRKG